METQIETRCIHGAGHKYQEDSRAISFPIYQTASFSHTQPGHNGSGFDYTRESNPTREYLEETVASLEGAAGVCRIGAYRRHNCRSVPGIGGMSKGIIFNDLFFHATEREEL